MSDNRHVRNEIELGMLQMQILWLVSKKPVHGYELMKRLNELKTTKVTQGTLYPALQRLEELSLIKRKKSDRIINYSITAKGAKIMNNSCIDFCRTFNGIIHDFLCNKCKV
jgi:DNA-binding PadR family transcriptional regulator